MRKRAIATACVLAALAFFFYNNGIASSPLTADETAVLTQARTISSAKPLFFHVADDRWLQPVAVYSTALIHALGGGDRSGRLASAIVGAVDVALVYIVVGLLANEWAALAAAMLLLLTPAHYAFARLGTDAIYTAPFVLLWIIALLRFIQFDAPKTLGAAAFVLGLGVYAHPTAPLIMAWLWIVTFAALIGWRRLSIRNLVALGGGVGIALLPLAIWFALHASTYPDTFGRWALFPAHARFPLDGLRAQMNWNTVGNRASVFWGLFDPSFLFFPAEGQRVAPFLACSALFALLGIGRVLSNLQPSQRTVVIAALLVPPVIASTFGQPHDLTMTTPLAATVAVIAGLGIESLRSRSRYWTLAAVIAVLFSAQQVWSLYHA